MPKQTAVPSYEEIDATVAKDNLFYQTPREMALKAISARLTAAEWSLWTYLQVLDPHGERLKDLPPVADLAKSVGISERQCHRALNRLKELELYYWEPVIIRGQNLAGKRVKEIRQHKNLLKSSDDNKLTKLSSPGQSCHDEVKVVFLESKLSSPGQSCLSDTLKPLPEGGCITPHTIHTYSDFIQTLSEEERENFLIFCKELASNLNQPVNDIEAWLASKTKAGQNRWEVYYQKFLARKEEQAKKMTRKTGRQLMEEFYAELEQKQQQAIEILNREQDQATAGQRGVTHV